MAEVHGLCAEHVHDPQEPGWRSPFRPPGTASCALRQAWLPLVAPLSLCCGPLAHAVTSLSLSLLVYSQANPTCLLGSICG